MRNEALYAGLSNCKLGLDTYDLGQGVVLGDTFAHMFAPFMVAFAPPAKPGDSLPAGVNPGPWKIAKGGFSFDVQTQLYVPENFVSSHWDNVRDVAWWITALLRIAHFPYVGIPVLSDMAFSSIPAAEAEPVLTPFETTRRIVSPPDDLVPVLNAPEHAPHLAWVRDHWIPGGELLHKNKVLDTSFRAFDAATFTGRPSSSMVLLWGALEQLFAPSGTEISFRVASYIAAYLKPSGPERLETRKQVSKLYNARSRAAHTSKEVDKADLISTWVLARNVLVKIIDENKVPDQAELEFLLYDGSSPSDAETAEAVESM